MTATQHKAPGEPGSEQHVTAPQTDAAIAVMEDEIFAERRRNRRRTTVTVWLIRLVGAVVILGGWYLGVQRGVLNPMFVSSPEDVAKAFVTQFGDPRFWIDARSTFAGAMAGLVLGATLGIFTGVVFSRLPVLERAMSPFLTLVNSLPRPALAPIFILWFGLGFFPKALVAASVVYFLMLTTTVAALRGIDHDVMQLTRSLSMSPMQRFLKIELPSALPNIVGALRLGAVYSVLGAVLSEMVGAYFGLGQRLVILTTNFQVAESFAVLLFMGLMAMALDYAISGLEYIVKRRSH